MSYSRSLGQFQPGIFGLPGRHDMAFGIPGPGSPGIDGAESGACQIEVDGRIIYGTGCTVSRGESGGPPSARAPEHAAVRAWRNFGEGSALMGDSMSYKETLIARHGYSGLGAGKSMEMRQTAQDAMTRVAASIAEKQSKSKSTRTILLLGVAAALGGVLYFMRKGKKR